MTRMLNLIVKIFNMDRMNSDARIFIVMEEQKIYSR